MRYSFMVDLMQTLLKSVNICKSCCKKFTATVFMPHGVYSVTTAYIFYVFFRLIIMATVAGMVKFDFENDTVKSVSLKLAKCKHCNQITEVIGTTSGFTR